MDVKLYLKEKSIKVTRGRVFILDTLEAINKPVDAEYIYEKSIKEGLEIDLSTVYRTLELLEQKEIIEKFDLGDGKYNYIIKDMSHNHTLQCELCHKSVIIDCPMAQIQQIIKNKTGFTLLEHDLKLKGICNECSKKCDSGKEGGIK